MHHFPHAARAKEAPNAKVITPNTTTTLVPESHSDSWYFRGLEALGVRLNKGQLDAVRHNSGPCLTIAGAGSGKTSVLAARASYLLSVAGVAPSNLLLVTFTKKAATEMKSRISSFVTADSAAVERITYGTFHSVFLRILRRSGFRQSVLSNQLFRQVIFRRILRELGLENNFEPEEALAIVSSLKVNLVSQLSGNVDDDVLNIWKSYDAWKQENNYIDFDDILVKTHEVLQADDSLLASLQRKFQYVLVDEWQDTNPVQYAVIKMLAQPQDNLFVVGDPDQTIFSYNGANVRIIIDFNKMYPQSRVVKLEANYRSTSHIIGLGNAVIRHNKSRFPKELYAVDSQTKLPLFIRPETIQDEAEFLVHRIIDEVKSEQRSHSDYGVLYRTAANSQALVEQFLNKDVPFIEHSEGNSTFFYDNSIVRPLMSYLRLIQDTDDIEAISNILPSLYIKREAGMVWIREQTALTKKPNLLMHLLDLPELSSFQRRKLQERLHLMDTLRNSRPQKAIQRLRPAYEEFLYQRRGHTLTHYKEMTRENLDTLEETSRRYRNVNDFLSYVDELKQKYDKMKKLRDVESADAVNLMTIHKSKGLEFPVVYAIGFSEDIVPHRLTTESAPVRDVFMTDKPSDKQDLLMEEERRLAYVCITRAREELILSSPATYRGKEVKVSRFLLDAFGGRQNPQQSTRRPASPGKRVNTSFPKRSRPSSTEPKIKNTGRVIRNEVLAWVCSSCTAWQRITSYEEANKKAKTCPLCGQSMKQESIELQGG